MAPETWDGNYPDGKSASGAQHDEEVRSTTLTFKWRTGEPAWFL